MNSLPEAIPFLSEQAPKAQSYADLRGKLAAEVGNRSPMLKLLDTAHERYSSGHNGPQKFYAVFDSIGSGLKVVKATPVAGPAPAQTPAHPPQKPSATAPASPAETLGKTVAALATSTNPAVRGPITQGLQQSLAEAAKPRPDFSIFTGLQRLSMSQEFDRLGGLSEQSHKLFMYQRKKFILENKVTPEQISGAKEAIIPEMISREDIAAREMRAKAAKNLPGLESLFHSINAKIVAHAQANPGSFNPQSQSGHAKALLRDRQEIMGRLNAAEKALGKPLTK